MSDSDVLTSEFMDVEEVDEKTLPEYYIARSKFYAEQGRDIWMIDGITEEKRYFHKFDEETMKIASAFYKRGLRKGDAVIYMIKDLIKVHILLTGVWRANGLMRASYQDDDEETILFRVKESNVKFIVCEEEAIPVCKGVLAKSPIKFDIITTKQNKLGFPSLDQFLEEDDGSDCPELLITEDDPALILCTSGTTGFPKGAVHTHGAFLYQIRALERIPFTQNKPNLLSSKATHVSGSSFGLILLGCGKTGVVVSNITPENIFKAAAKYKPGFLFAFPTFVVAMTGSDAAGYDFSSIEIIFTGGSPITPATKQSFFKLPGVTDFVVVYGLTEIMLCTTSAIMKQDQERETPSFRDLPDFSVGKVFPGSKIQIRDPDTLKVLGANQRGEICVKSPGLFQSYLNNPDATKKAFVDGYFRTGDIGYFDNKGFIYVVDRSKEIFKYYNDHISPTELEGVIGKHPKVSECCVIGVEDVGGYVPRAFVTIHPNPNGNVKDIEEEIKEFANANLAPYKHLRGGVYVVDDLPKGKTGKITRQLLEKLPVPY